MLEGGEKEYWKLLEAYRTEAAKLEADLKRFRSVIFGRETYEESINFFGVISRLNKLDGFYIQALIRKKQAEGKFEDIIHAICKKHSQYIFDGEKISFDIKRKNRDVHDIDRVIGFEELTNMSDLACLFMLNAYDLPYCNSEVSRGIYEDFFSDLLKRLRENAEEGEEASRFSFVEQSFPHFGVILRAWVCALRLIAEIFKNINSLYKLAFNKIQLNSLWIAEQLPENFPMDELSQFFGQYLIAHKAYFRSIGVDLMDDGQELLISGVDKVKEQRYISAMPGFEVFGDFLHIKFYTLLFFGKREENLSSANELVNRYIDNLQDTAKGIYTSAIETSRLVFDQFKAKKPSAVCLEVCEYGLKFFGEFQNFLNMLTQSTSSYNSALVAAKFLLDTNQLGWFAYEKVVTKSGSGPTTPRTPRSVGSGGYTTPRGHSAASSPRTPSAVSSNAASSPRAAGRVNSPRVGLATSTGSPVSSPRNSPGPRSSGKPLSGSESFIMHPPPRTRVLLRSSDIESSGKEDKKEDKSPKQGSEFRKSTGSMQKF